SPEAVRSRRGPPIEPSPSDGSRSTEPLPANKLLLDHDNAIETAGALQYRQSLVVEPLGRAVPSRCVAPILPEGDCRRAHHREVRRPTAAGAWTSRIAGVRIAIRISRRLRWVHSAIVLQAGRTFRVNQSSGNASSAAPLWAPAGVCELAVPPAALS